MKKILIRAGMSPLVNYNPTKVITKNLIGKNIGNMLFPYSISRALMLEETVIDAVDTSRRYSDKDVRYINENYDCLILPFANAFRKSFIAQLNGVTDLVNKLKIPCVLVGIGMQADLSGNKTAAPELDEAVSRFLKAILKKSAKIGIRGEFTADYLTNLGFQAERDFTVIGCPSMFLYGKELPQMEVKELTPESSVSMNSKIQLPQKFHDFMHRCSQEIPDHYYITQVLEEISRMYIGKPYPSSFVPAVPKHFPVEFTHPIYQSGRGVSFANFPSWMEFLKDRDFSFGSRIHGNIAAILAGTPCYIIVSDQRIKELVEYHHLPHLFMKDLKEDTSIFDLHEKADFTAIRKGHEERFMHYLGFLQENGLETIFDKEGNAPEDTPFDRKIREVEFAPPIKAFSALTPEEQLKRLQDYHRAKKEKEHYLRKQSPEFPEIVENYKSRLLHKKTKSYAEYYPFIRKSER